jgi:hypothetical protein
MILLVSSSISFSYLRVLSKDGQWYNVFSLVLVPSSFPPKPTWQQGLTALTYKGKDKRDWPKGHGGGMLQEMGIWECEEFKSGIQNVDVGRQGSEEGLEIIGCCRIFIQSGNYYTDFILIFFILVWNCSCTVSPNIREVHYTFCRNIREEF